MAKLFKNSKQILAIIMAFAVLAVSLFAGSIVVGAEDVEGICKGTRIEYWNGNKDDQLDGKGTKDEPYIITNAAELNYVCTANSVAGTQGKYFVVDPDIKAFILQPEAVVTALGGDSALMDIASAAETKELFEVKAASVTLQNWLKNGNANNYFLGNFDGNGVEIYGLYADDALRGTQQCALFPIVDGGTTDKPVSISNLIIRNSYFKGARRVGALIATAWWNQGGAKVDGHIDANNIEIGNCFLVGQDVYNGNMATWGIGEMGVVGGAMANDPMKVNGLSVYGNETEYRVYGSVTNTTYSVDSSKNFNRLFAQNGASSAGEYGELHNTIALGTLVSGLNNNTDKVTYISDVYSNVKSSVKDVTFVENAFSAEGQAAMSTLDWEKDWFMGLNGPTFRAFHGTISLVQTDTTHYYACKDCGFMSYGGEIEHNWDAEYVCSDCGWKCNHGSQIIDEYRDGNCVTAPGYYTECNYCTWEDIEYIGDPAGHVLEWVDEIYADCENTGREGYYHCTECGGNYQADSEEAAKWAAMDTNIVDPDSQLIIPIAPHNATNRADGSVLVYAADAEGHWWVCYTCDGRLLAVESDEYAEEGALKKHKYEDSVCIDCGWECTEHNYEATGTVAVAGSCTVDREEEVKCTICGDKQAVVTELAGHKIVKVEEVAATDKLEGTKAHYKCSVCQEIYTDAEGKTKATAAELIIAKTLPAGYENVEMGNINTDNSNKSPATGDSLASVLAVAAIAGVAFVAARKIVK